MSGEMRTAAVTPARSSTPATSAPSIWPTDVPAKPARMNAPIIAEVTAATGTPTAIASPALAAAGGVPSAAEAAALLREGLAAIPAERLWVNPDCGLKTRGWPETRASLENLVAAAHAVRGELPVS